MKMIKIKKGEMVLFLIILICMGEEVCAETFPEEINNQENLFEDDPPPNPDDFENLEPGSYNIINSFNQEMDLRYNNSGLDPQMPIKTDGFYEEEEEEELVQEEIMEEEIMEYEKEVKTEKTEEKEETGEMGQIIEENSEQIMIRLENQQKKLMYAIGVSVLTILGLLIFIFYKFKFKKTK